MSPRDAAPVEEEQTVPRRLRSECSATSPINCPLSASVPHLRNGGSSDNNRTSLPGPWLGRCHLGFDDVSFPWQRFAEPLPRLFLQSSEGTPLQARPGWRGRLRDSLEVMQRGGFGKGTRALDLTLNWARTDTHAHTRQGARGPRCRKRTRTVRPNTTETSASVSSFSSPTSITLSFKQSAPNTALLLLNSLSFHHLLTFFKLAYTK